MTPLMHPELINDWFGDPGVYVDFLHDRRALLLDLGDLGVMSSRKLLRVTHAFVIHLVDRADLLFIESPFLHEDADIAKRKMHLTARQAGQIAQRAHVRRFEQFHFSPRYEGRGERLRQEGLAAFSGREVAGGVDNDHKRAL